MIFKFENGFNFTFSLWYNLNILVTISTFILALKDIIIYDEKKIYSL